MVHRNVVTRFAPSPTGYLHIGGARTALFNWAFARHHGGTFILRMEDTDAVRSSMEAAHAIIEDLRWLGMDWDEGPDPDADDPMAQELGEVGPYWQSRRKERGIYDEYIERLLKADLAYEDDGAVRFRMPRRDITVHDLVLGAVTTPADKIEDLVIRKSDGFPTFHFANVIDDATMGVTHVIRAQEHLNNTHKHLALFEALGLTPPQYAHIPLIFNPDGSKMSKRDKAKAARKFARERIDKVGMDQTVREIAEAEVFQTAAASQKEVGELEQHLAAVDIQAFIEGGNDNILIAEKAAQAYGLHLPEINVAEFREGGYLPDVLDNYLALLGWNPGGDVEKFDTAFLVEQFSLDRVGKANARFDRDKLASFNADAIKAMAPEEFAERLGQLMRQSGDPALVQFADDSRRLELLAQAYGERAQTLGEPLRAGRFVFTADDAIEYDEKAVAKVLRKNEDAGFAVLAELPSTFEGVSFDQPEAIEQAVKDFAAAREVGMGKVAQPIRVAVTGSTVSPPLGMTLAVLGKQATLRRIERALALRGE